MKCNNCGNTEVFIMIKEIAVWNKKEKKFEPMTDGAEYYVCDVCMNNTTDIDTEGNY